MKAFLFLTCVLLSFGASANELIGKTIICGFSDPYLSMTGTVEVAVTDQVLVRISDEEAYISWSETECEDSTNLTIDTYNLEKLLNMKKAYAELAHAGPEVVVTGEVRCRLELTKE